MKPHSLFRTKLFLIPLLTFSLFSARATITVQNYWRLGENDPGAGAGVAASKTTDLIGAATITNFPGTPSVLPVYGTNVSALAATATGSQYGILYTNGQYGVGRALPGLTNNFGLELWVNPASVDANQCLFYNGNTGSSGFGLYVFYGNFAVLYGNVAYMAGPAATPGVWTHLALVCHDGITTLYVNGSAAASRTLVPFNAAGNTLAAVNTGANDYFVGMLDEVRLFTFASGQFSASDLLYFQNPPFIVSTNAITVAAAAGMNSFGITSTTSNASWNASADVPWLHLLNSSGTGAATVSFSYDDNPGTARAGNITLGGQTVSITQSAASLSFALGYTYFYQENFLEVLQGAGTNTVAMTVSPNVAQWTCSSPSSWIHLRTTNGIGSSNISFTCDANTGGLRQAEVDFFNFNASSGSQSFNTKFMVWQQPATPGPGQQTYTFTGKLIQYVPGGSSQPFPIPNGASTALKSVRSNDVFFLTMTLDTTVSPIFYETYAFGAAKISFTVPSRGLTYNAPAADFDVSHDFINPDTLRWDDNAVDASVNMTFWARDFTLSALPNGSMPNPLNLSGFHLTAGAGTYSGLTSFAQIILSDGANGGATLFYADLVPVPGLNLQQQTGTNVLSWVTTDATYTPVIQTATNLTAATWQTVTNLPLTLGTTNLLRFPPPNAGTRFYRLKVL